MPLKISNAVKNAMLDAFETAIGTSAILRIRTGSPPANITDADSGTVLATLNLPSDWMAAASGGSKSMLGTWQDTEADNTGTAGHFRLYSSGGTAHLQGNVATSGADLNLDSTSITAGQQVTITTFTLSMGN